MDTVKHIFVEYEGDFIFLCGILYFKKIMYICMEIVSTMSYTY